MTEHTFHVEHRVISDPYKAAALAYMMIHLSCWFEVEPLPDDERRFTFKPEWATDVDAYIASNESREG